MAMGLSDHYQQAIMLNNMGVSLFNKRAFSPAMETFRNALDEMKILVDGSEDLNASLKQGMM